MVIVLNKMATLQHTVVIKDVSFIRGKKEVFV